MKKRAREKVVEGLSKDEAIGKMLPRIHIIAKTIATQMSAHAHFDDLVSAGMIGVADAFEKFDPDKFTKFSTYAEIRIRGAMIDELRAQSWMPRSVQNNLKQVNRVHESFERTAGRRATDVELRDALGERASVAKTAVVLNIDEYRRFNERDREAFVRESDRTSSFDPFAAADKKNIRERLDEVTSHLNEKQRQVILLYYFEGLKNIDISQRLGISESRVSQLHKEAMTHMRRDKDLQVILQCLYKDLAA